jgi:hypothetical protein
MNVFVTDHPMMSQPRRANPRRRKLAIFVLLAYPTWLLLLGPFWALDGRGRLDLIPEKVRQCVYLPMAVWGNSPVFPSIFEPYMNWWFDDPNAGETTL